MKPFATMLAAILLAVAGASGLPACSQQSTGGDEVAPSAASAPAPATPGAPAAVAASNEVGDSPCNLLTDAEVRAVFPTAESGKRNTSSLEYGLDRCGWETPTGRIGIEISHIEADAFENELRGELSGVIDPRIQGAADRIRLQSIPGIGDHAFAVLEKADAQRGILADVALLAIQRGHRMAVLMVHEASSSAPAPSLESLETLGRPLASRL